MAGMAGRRARRVGLAALAALLAGAVTAGCQPPPYSWDRQLASQPSGPSTDTGWSDEPVFSADGTKVAFVSLAGDLGPTDTNNRSDVYVRDLVSGTTTLVSANAAGTSGGSDQSDGPVFSPDGTKVAFRSYARDLLVSPATIWGRNVYVRDLATATTTLATPSADGTGGQVGDIQGPRFAGDGTKVLFVTTASNLGPVDTNDRFDVYLRDLDAGITTLVSANATGTDATNGGSQDVAPTPDGSAVLFHSDGSDLGPVDTNDDYDVYMRALGTGATTLVSTNAAGTGSGNGFSGGALASPDGRRVLFASNASDLVPTDTNQSYDLYLRDLDNGTTTLVSANAAGTDSGNGHTTWASPPAFSADGKLLVFESDASDLVADDGNSVSDIFVRDLDTGTTRLASVGADGTGSADGFSYSPTISADGSAVAFVSFADDLGPQDTNGRRDVYIRDLVHEVTGLVSSNAANDDSADGFSDGPVFAPDGTRIAFVTTSDDLGLPPSSHTREVVVTDGRQADVSVTLSATPETIASNDVVTYEVELTNSGPHPAVEARTAFVLPEATTFWGAQVTNGTCELLLPIPVRLVTCDFGDLDPGERRTMSVAVKVDAGSGTMLSALAVASSRTADADHADNSARHESPVT